MAAAITAEATHLVTNNLDDFPADKMPDGLLIAPPDVFVTGLADEDIETVLQVVETQAGHLKNPPITITELLDGLEEVELVAFVHRVRAALG